MALIAVEVELSRSDWLSICLSVLLSGPLLEYLLGACLAYVRAHFQGICRQPVRASLGVSVVATVGVSVKTSLDASVGASVRTSVRVFVEPSVGASVDLNCIMYSIMLSS